MKDWETVKITCKKSEGNVRFIIAFSCYYFGLEINWYIFNIFWGLCHVNPDQRFAPDPLGWSLIRPKTPSLTNAQLYCEKKPLPMSKTKCNYTKTVSAWKNPCYICLPRTLLKLKVRDFRGNLLTLIRL